MEISEYQDACAKTAVYPDIGNNLPYTVLGLCGETGEVAEKVKKLLRDKDGRIDDEFSQEILKELGDVMWYLAAVCNELRISMNYVARHNIDKIQSRIDRGTLQGSGDNR